MPFSDPLADGPVIQRATERAIAAGGSLRASLAMIAKVRPQLKAPIVVFSYANPLLRLGLDAFARQAAEAGVDGVLALDLPIEEAGAFRDTLARAGIDTIFLLSPTTTDTRIKTAAAQGSGFLYGISRLGVTGARAEVAAGRGSDGPADPRPHDDADCARVRNFHAGTGRRGLHLRRCRSGRQRAGVGDCRGQRRPRSDRQGRERRAT